MVHLRSVVLWLGVIAVLEGVFALGLAAISSGEAVLADMGSDASSLAATLIPAGIAGLVLWLVLSLLNAHRRAAAEAAPQARPPTNSRDRPHPPPSGLSENADVVASGSQGPGR